jgi:dolichyl-phosphate-mannose--protein O-mannosyl transferase
MAPLLVALLYLPWLLTSRQAYIFYMTPVVPFLAILVATGLCRIAGGRPSPCAPQAFGFGGGALLTAGVLGAAGLGEGLLGTARGALWRGGAAASGAALAAAAVITAMRSPQRRRTITAVLAWAYVGATAGLALAWLPFLLGYPVLFEYYQRLTWFVTWK